MDKYPLVSVLVPAYNMAETIGDTLDSLMEQTWPNWELIVINDGSRDATAEVIQSRLSAAPEHLLPRLHYLVHDNQGKTRTLNRALSMARGEYIAILDADDTWPSDSLALRLDALMQKPDAAGIYGDANYMDRNGDVYKVRHSRPVNSIAQVVGGITTPIIGPTMLMRAQAIRDFTPLDGTYARSEDQYINAELFLRGELIYLPKVVLNYRNYFRWKDLKLRVLSVYHHCRIIARYCTGTEMIWLILRQVFSGCGKLLIEFFTSKK